MATRPPETPPRTPAWSAWPAPAGRPFRKPHPARPAAARRAWVAQHVAPPPCQWRGARTRRPPAASDALSLETTLLGAFTADDVDRAAVLTFILRYFPVPPEFLTAQLDSFRQMRVPIGVAGLLTLLWAALGVFGAITTAVNEAWGVEHHRSFLGRRLISFLTLAAAGLVLVCGLLLVSLVQMTDASWFGARLGALVPLQALQSLTLRSLPTLLAIAGCGFLFCVVPNARIRLRDVWIGAVLTGVLWRTGFGLFAWYVRTSTLSLIHGSVTAVVVFLLWVYVSAVILIYGVEFTAERARLRGGKPMPVPPARPAIERA